MAAPAVKTSAPWCTIADLPAKASDGRWELDLTAGGEMADWIQVASDVLFNLTKRRWPGATTATIRPMVAAWGGYIPHQSDTKGGGTWIEARRGTTITSDGVSEILLPNPPVVSITEILIDGAVVNAANYRVDDWRRLVYLPSAGLSRTTWPSWQDLDAATSDDGTFAVTYVHGTAPPEGGKRACAELATELGISASPKLAGQSRLPSRTTSVSRQGVSAAVLDPLTLFAEGQTGIPSVDLWIVSTNLGANQRRGRVKRLGQRGHRRTTSP